MGRAGHPPQGHGHRVTRLGLVVTERIAHQLHLTRKVSLERLSLGQWRLARTRTKDERPPFKGHQVHTVPELPEVLGTEVPVEAHLIDDEPQAVMRVQGPGQPLRSVQEGQSGPAVDGNAVLVNDQRLSPFFNSQIIGSIQHGQGRRRGDGGQRIALHPGRVHGSQRPVVAPFVTGGRRPSTGPSQPSAQQDQGHRQPGQRPAVRPAGQLVSQPAQGGHGDALGAQKQERHQRVQVARLAPGGADHQHHLDCHEQQHKGDGQDRCRPPGPGLPATQQQPDQPGSQQQCREPAAGLDVERGQLRPVGQGVSQIDKGTRRRDGRGAGRDHEIVEEPARGHGDNYHQGLQPNNRPAQPAPAAHDHGQHRQGRQQKQDQRLVHQGDDKQADGQPAPAGAVGGDGAAIPGQKGNQYQQLQQGIGPGAAAPEDGLGIHRQPKGG